MTENAAILRNILQGRGKRSQQDVVALNASLALQVAELVPFGDSVRGVETAREILASGAAWQKLENLVGFLS